jgi:hypothetical protein
MLGWGSQRWIPTAGVPSQRSAVRSASGDPVAARCCHGDHSSRVRLPARILALHRRISVMPAARNMQKQYCPIGPTVSDGRMSISGEVSSNGSFNNLNLHGASPLYLPI